MTNMNDDDLKKIKINTHEKYLSNNQYINNYLCRKKILYYVNIEKNCIVIYFDDILVYSKSLYEYMYYLKSVLYF